MFEFQGKKIIQNIDGGYEELVEKISISPKQKVKSRKWVD